MPKKKSATKPVAGPSLFPEWEAQASDVPPVTTRTYDPLPSVWEGSDAALLEKMLVFYPHKHPTKILDATVNTGRFWVGSKRKIVGVDIDPRVKPDVVADNTNMPFADGSFQVIRCSSR